MQPRKNSVLIVMALVAVFLAGGAFILLQNSNPVEERGTLSGTVVNASDSRFLKGVSVTAIDQDGERYTSHENTDTTGDDGFFRLELPPNDYTLLFEADGFQPFESSASYNVKKEKDTEIKEAFRLAAAEPAAVEAENPAAEPAAAQAAEPAAVQAEEPAAEPAAAQAQKPAAEPAAAQAEEPAAEPEAAQAEKPEVEPAAAHVEEPVVEPAAVQAEELAEAELDEEEYQAYLIPSDAAAYGDHHYYIYSGEKCTWDEALSQCLDQGGYLAVINDPDENEFLYQYMVDGGHEQAFFGLSMQDGDWEYIAGDTSDFRDWGYNSKEQKQPNNADEGFTQVSLDTNMHDGYWSDSAFGKQTYTSSGRRYGDIYTYICEWDE